MHIAACEAADISPWPGLGSDDEDVEEGTRPSCCAAEAAALEASEHCARDQYRANNRLSKGAFSAGAGVTTASSAVSRAVCCHDCPINIVLINNHRDPDLRSRDHLNVHPDVRER